jgi:cobalt transporter subunit CbtA
MITRVLAVGLLAGLLAGLSVAVLQAFTTTPIILKAEVFERGEAAPQASASPRLQPALYRSTDMDARVILVHEGEQHAGATAAEAWSPGDGLERTLFTSTATVATAIGFALILIAGMLAAGDAIEQRTAMAWAAAGFAATGLAPALGLSPELPGMAASDLAGRQEWWMITAAATAGALWLFLRADRPVLRLLAIPLALAPHVWGAPYHVTEAVKSSVPPELAAQFAATSLAVQAILWVLTGFFVGLLWGHIGSRRAAAPARG